MACRYCNSPSFHALRLAIELQEQSARLYNDARYFLHWAILDPGYEDYEQKATALTLAAAHKAARARELMGVL